MTFKLNLPIISTDSLSHSFGIRCLIQRFTWYKLTIYLGVSNCWWQEKVLNIFLAVSGVCQWLPCIEQWWGRVRLGERTREILDTEHNTSDVTFFSILSAKIRPWTHGTAASEDSFEAGISVLIPGIIRLNWTKRCCPPSCADISESRSPAQHTPDFVVTQQTCGAFPETWNQQPRSFDWIIELNDWPDDALDGELFRDGKRENVVMEGWGLMSE